MHLWKLPGKALESSLEGVLKEIMDMAMHGPGKMRHRAILEEEERKELGYCGAYNPRGDLSGCVRG